MLEHHSKAYELFSGRDLEVAERIQHLRYLMLIHSRIYYVLNNNLMPDKEFDELARELRDLQHAHPFISSQVDWYDAFMDWDGSTGAFLPLDDPWVIEKTSLVFTLDKRAAKYIAKEAGDKLISPFKDKEILPQLVEELDKKSDETTVNYGEENEQLSFDDLFEMEM